MPKAKHREHGEIRKSVGVELTTTALQGLTLQAQQLGISRSELLERIGRGDIPLGSASQIEACLGESLAN